MLNKNNAQHEYDELIYGISHDFHAPLRHAKSFSRLLWENKEHNENDKEYFNILQNALEKMDKMLLSTLTLSRISEGNKNIENVAIGSIIGSVLKELQSDIESNNITVTLSSMPALNISRQNMMIVFRELIKNTIQFSQKKSPAFVDIQYQKTEECHIITISDNGQGIHVQNPDYLFQLFSVGSKSNPQCGIGAGLAIVKKIVHLNNGEISIKQNKEIFTVTMVFPH